MNVKMKQQNKIQNLILLAGAALMIVGVGGFVLMWHKHIMCWLFLLGTVMFSVIQSMQIYEGNSFIVKRLKRIQAVASIFFLISAIFMVDTSYQFLIPLFRNSGNNGYQNYLAYVYNKWVVFLLIAAILELYTTYRIGAELQKEKKLKSTRNTFK